MNRLTLRLAPALLVAGVALAAKAPNTATGPDLFRAIRDSDYQRVEKLLRRGASPNFADAAGTTALMYSALHGNAALVKLLLEKGADPNAANQAGATALMWAVPDFAASRLLLDRGANPNARSKEGRTPLLIAARRQGSAETIRLLIAKGADANAVDEQGGTALMLAAEAGDMDVVRLLLDRGADVNRQASPLFMMPRFGTADGPPGPRPKGVGMTALLSAAYAGNTEIVRVLLDKGADPNRAMIRGFTPLMYASLLRDPEMAKLLLAKGADVHAREMRQATALILAASSDDTTAETVRLLLEKGADWKAKDTNGNTALDWASKRGRTEIAAVLRRAEKGNTSNTSDEARVTESVHRSLGLLQRTSVEFTKKSGCLSCHHQSILQVTTAAARARGFVVDEDAARHVTRFTAAVAAPHREPMLQGVPTIPASAFVSSYALIGLSAEGQPADDVTDALTIELAARQRADGRWTSDNERPPLGQGAITATALTLRSLQLYAPPGRRREFEERVQRAAAWLAATPGQTTQEKAMRVLGLAWAKSDVRDAAGALLSAQRGDGGWAQMPALESDAYGTGLAMYALYESGIVKTTDAAYRRGVEFLLDTQQADGSWHVRSRALGFQRQFESGYPHGHDQWISAAGGAWATLALSLTREPGRNLASAR